MRKPRDYDKELNSLANKVSQLKTEKIQRLGELLIATGADRMDVETLTGALLHIVRSANLSGNKEMWRSQGAAFFQNGRREYCETPSVEHRSIVA